MTDLEREAREAAVDHGEWLEADADETNYEAFVAGYLRGYSDRGVEATASRDEYEQEIERLRAKLDEAKSAIRWMHGYDEPGTEDFPFCPEGKRFAWRSVARQQFAIVREACAEPIPLPEPKEGEGGR